MRVFVPVTAVAILLSIASAKCERDTPPGSSTDKMPMVEQASGLPSAEKDTPFSNSAGQSSDLRLKRNVTAITNSLPVILNLRGICFQWRADDFPHRHFDNSRHLGFIAQEMRDVLPQVIGKDAEDYYTIATGEIIPVLVEAIKDMNLNMQQQKAMIQQKDRKLANMESRLADLEKSITTLTNRVQELLEKSSAR